MGVDNTREVDGPRNVALGEGLIDPLPGRIEGNRQAR
jgi:hypothetical protein